MKAIVSMGPALGLVATVSSISVGQLLFKIAAERANSTQSVMAPNVLSTLVYAVVLYSGATLIWVWVLRNTPLTTAYLFTSLSFVIVPILAKIFLHEPLTTRIAVGLMLIVCGIVVSGSGR